jgi:hypothetical protein
MEFQPWNVSETCTQHLQREVVARYSKARWDTTPEHRGMDGEGLRME